MDTEAEAIAKLAVNGTRQAHTVSAADGREFLVIPQNYTSQEVTDPHGAPAKKPPFVKQSVTLQATDSLVEYVNRFKSADTVLFADISSNTINALIDYHGAPATPAHVAHRATMTLPFSEEWKIWQSINGKLMPQLEFARFIEENGADVRAPEGAELLEVVRDLQARRNVNFTKAVRTATDNENFEFSDETEARSTKGGIELPAKFLLGVPVYFGEPDRELYAFLRWRLGEGALQLGIALHRHEHVRQAEFKQIVVNVGSLTGCPVVFGKAV
ncbi:MAG: DUF2303 family protein [Rhizobiales bacterium]|nr:DUF2303 family protein [Hyphomicrobiales bacterium]